MEDGLLPHSRSLDDPDQLEEERRIAYVGVTRARERLYLCRALRRRIFGGMGAGLPSRFLKDVPPDLIEKPDRSGRRAEREAARVHRPPAAAAANGAAPPPFRAGEKVAHPAFGLGVVVNCASRPGDYEITIAFAGNQGVKRLLHSYGKLERAGA